MYQRKWLSTILDNLRGSDNALDLEQLYNEFSELSSPETLEGLRELGSKKNEDRPVEEALGSRSIDHLIEFVGNTIERRAAVEPFQRQMQLETSLSLDVGGERYPYRALLREIQRETNPDRRAALERALLEARMELTPIRAEFFLRAREAAASVGGEDYIDWRSRLSRIDIEAVASQARSILDETDDMAQDALDWLLRRRVEGCSGQPIRQHDYLFATRAAHLDPMLAPGELWRIDDFLEKMGLDPTGGGHIIRDDEPQPNKSPRAFCVPVKVPEQIHLVLPTTGGLPQWRALLHELGHALHFAHTSPELPIELKRMGDASLSEGFAILFDHLLTNPIWVKRVLKLPAHDADNLVRTAASASLLTTRRHCAKLIHELAFHRGDPDAPELYVELGRRALGFQPPEAGHLLDIDPELYVSRYVRAWMFEALAHEELREQYDEDWFLNPKVGSLLRSLFRSGQRENLDEMAARAMGQQLAPDRVAKRFEEVLA